MSTNLKPVPLFKLIKQRLEVEKWVVKKTKRTPSIVKREYDQSNWNRKYKDVDYDAEIKGLDNKPDEEVILRMNRELFLGTRRDYADKYNQQFLDEFDDLINEGITELGCGIGNNLFLLQRNNAKNLEGYDISENAIAIADRYSKENSLGIKFGILDLIKPFPEGIIKDRVVFTNTCLEQVKRYMPAVLKNIMDGKPKLVINFEDNFNAAPKLVRRYFNLRDYQDNLVDELKKLEMRDKISLEIKDWPLQISPVHYISSIVWKIRE